MASLSSSLTDPGWRAVLSREFEKPYFRSLEESLSGREREGVIIYPPRDHIFAAFNATPFERVKVVILGQDPYHGAGQAMGLSFSVPEGVRIPPSLRNMFKEIEADLGAPAPASGDLRKWAEQGVLLLNSVLSVEEKKAGAHAKFGWQTFTDFAISALSAQRTNIVFMLWGAYAQKKAGLVNSDAHLILTGPHPSPLSAYRGFFGCQHFSKANTYLTETHQGEISW